MKDGSYVCKGLSRSSARGYNKISTLYAETNSFQLVLIDRVASENVRHRGMKYARFSYTLDAPNLFVGRVELEERVGPELTIGQCRMHRPADIWISDIDEALDVIGVIGDDTIAQVKDVHRLASSLRCLDSLLTYLSAASRI